MKNSNTNYLRISHAGDIFSAERKFSEARRMTNTADSELRDFIDRK